MFKPKFYFNPDPDGGGGGDTVTVDQVKEVSDPKEALSFDKVEGDPFAKINETTEPKQEEKSKDEIAKERTDKIEKLGLKAEATDDEISAAEKEFEKKNLPENKAKERADKIAKYKLKEDATDDDIKAAEEAEENSDELKLENEDPKDNKSDEDTTWLSLGKDLGLEVKADTFESLKESFDAAIEKVRAEEREKQYELTLKDHSPEAQEFVKFLDNGGKLEEFINPLRVFDEALSLSDEELVTISLQNQKWDEEKIKEQIEVLKENSTLEQTAYGLRKQVENNKAAKAQKILNDQQLKFKASEEKRLAEEQKENEAIKSVIDKIEDFHGGKLSKETKEALYKKHLRGDYRRRLESSPEDAVKAMLYLEFGEKQFKQLAKDKFQEGKEKVAKNLHNTKKQEKPGTRIPTGNEGFGAWDAIFQGQK